MRESTETFVATCRAWVEALRDDVAVMKTLLTADGVAPEGRKLAATALNYVVTRLDLVPDHEPAIGAVDDAMILRLCAASAVAGGHDKALARDALLALGRLANEAERIEPFIGAELYAKLRKRCERLAEEPVRDRTPERIVTDAASRTQLLLEVERELTRMPAASFADPDAIARQLMSYLKAKLD